MIKVIHIRSSGRSGSTLLNILLDKYDQVYSGAELFRYRWLWTRIETIQSANGELVSESVFWNKVKKRIKLSVPVTQLEPETFDKSEVTSLFTAICAISGKSVICDTSKSPRYSSIIYDPEIYDTAVVHLIRDGRAVVNSHNLSLLGTARVAALWSITNFLSVIPLVRKKVDVRLKYEDLVFETEACIDEVRAIIEKRFDLTLSSDSRSDTAQYAFAGNSMRANFDGTVFYDTRYLRDMGFLKWWMCTFIMLPTLLVFRYPLRRSGFSAYVDRMTKGG